MTKRILLATALLLTACGKKDAPAATDKGAQPTEKEARKEEAPPKNAALVAHVKKMAEACTVNVEQGQAYSCKDKASDDARDFVNKEKPTDFFATLVQIVESGEKKESAVAIAMIDDYASYLGTDALKKQASKFVVDHLLAALKNEKENRASRLAQETTHLAMIAGRQDDLWPIVDKHENKYVRNRAYMYAMTYGRLAALPKLKEVAKEKTHAAAALEAPRNMYNATDEEKSAYCPWAEGYLGDDDANVASQAGYTMVNCKGKYVDALLAEAQKRVDAGKFKNPFAMVMREPCFEFIAGVSGKGGQPEQCERVYAFLEKTANDKRVDDDTRAMSLWNIYYQRRDKKTLDLMRKYENSPVKPIAAKAKDAIKSLTDTYKLK